jgi:hypothetical protein
MAVKTILLMSNLRNLSKGMENNQKRKVKQKPAKMQVKANKSQRQQTETSASRSK